MLPETFASLTLLAGSASLLYNEALISDVTAVKRFTPFPPILHSESSSPPEEARKAETPLSKESGSSKKPAKVLNLRLHKARVWSALAMSIP